jgi:hypothetical protein
MGIVPSSERKQSGEPLSGMPSNPASKLRDKIERLRHERDNSDRLKKWHQKQTRRHNKIVVGKNKNLKELEDIQLTPEEEAELAIDAALFAHNLNLGERCDLACVQSTETLMCGSGATLQKDEIDCNVDRLGLPKNATITKELSEQRQRLNFSFEVTALTVNVETLVIQTPQGSEIISASLDDIGPPKMRVTWEYLANMAIMVTQYAVPLNRFANLVSSSVKQFTAGEMSRYFNYVATRFAPIYTTLGRSLANAEVISGDDTSSHVLEVVRGLSALEANSNAVVSWDLFANTQQARVALELGLMPMASYLAATFGFEFDRKNGNGQKRGFNTTVISGRTNTHEPKSTVIFYRSHLGGLGNLLDMILLERKKELAKLVVQCDLSTVNLVSNSSHKELFNIDIAGCASHARRPFALYEKDDPEICAAILHEFKGVFMYEQCIDRAGRNTENTLAVRANDIKACWENIRQYCEIAQKHWSSKTPVGAGARYVLRHYEKLTYYLGDLRVMPSNNFSERMLRLEKVIENNSMFRQTIEGRCALDIMRTVLQTAVAAKVDLRNYLLWVMRMPDDVVAKEPSAFTPLAYAHHIASTTDSTQSSDAAA